MPFTRKQCIYLLEHYLATKSYADTITLPPSPDLSLLDYFSWGYLKDKIFETAVPNKNCVKELWKKFNESRPTTSLWYSKIFDDGHSCAKMFWEPSSNTFCKIKSFSFLQCSVFVGCELSDCVLNDTPCIKIEKSIVMISRQTPVPLNCLLSFLFFLS